MARPALDLVRSLRRDGVPIDDNAQLTGRFPRAPTDLPDLQHLRDPGVTDDLQRKLMRYIREHNKRARPIKAKYADPTHRIRAHHSAGTSN